MNSDYRIAATLYSQGTWLVSGICVNSLHKEKIIMMIIMTMMMMMIIIILIIIIGRMEDWRCSSGY
jgi:hypothetical protein